MNLGVRESARRGVAAWRPLIPSRPASSLWRSGAADRVLRKVLLHHPPRRARVAFHSFSTVIVTPLDMVRHAPPHNSFWRLVSTRSSGWAVGRSPLLSTTSTGTRFFCSTGVARTSYRYSAT